MLVWTGNPAPDSLPLPLLWYRTVHHWPTPRNTSCREDPHRQECLEGERKQVTVLFADLKGSMELLADRDPEEARQLLDPVLARLMAAVHRYEVR